MSLLCLKQWVKSKFPARGQVHRAGRTAHRSPCRSFRPMLESLEDRWLPSGTAILGTMPAAANAPASSAAPSPSTTHVHSPSSSTGANVHKAPIGSNADGSTTTQTTKSDDTTTTTTRGQNADGSPRSQTSQAKTSPAGPGSTQEHGSHNTAPNTATRGLAVGNSLVAGTNSSASASDDDGGDDDDSSNNGPAGPAATDDYDADSSSSSESAPGAITCRLGNGSSNDDDSSDDAFSNAGGSGQTKSPSDESDDPTDAEDDTDDNSQDDAPIEGGNPSTGDSDSDDSNTNPDGTLPEEIDWLNPDADLSLSRDDSPADGSAEGDIPEMSLYDPIAANEPFLPLQLTAADPDSPADDLPATGAQPAAGPGSTADPIQYGLLHSLETDVDWVALNFPGGPGAFQQLAEILQIEADN
jgi:hypothetical protein